MVMYGSYIKLEEFLFKLVFWIGVGDVGVVLLVGFFIVFIVLVFGLDMMVGF